MTKLWPYEVGAKLGDYSNAVMLGTDFVTLTIQSIPMSRCCCMISQRSGSVLGGCLAHFESIMEGFKAQTRGIEKEEDL